MNNILVYRHRTLDTNKVFYVGIGSYKRSKEKIRRSDFWKNVLDTSTGIIYNSVKEVSILFNFPYLKLNRRLNGTTTNNTKFIYYNE